MHRIHLLLLAIIILLSKQVLGQLPDDLKAEDCPFGIYGQFDQQPCICLNQGLWGVASDYCSAPLKLYGVSPGSQFCFTNNFPQKKVRLLQKTLTMEEPEMAQLSFSMHKLIDRFDKFSTSVPFPEDIYLNKSTLISYGETKWTLTTNENETYCLVHQLNPLNHYCIFQPISYGDKWLKVESVEPGCQEGNHLPKILPTECFPLNGNQSCEEAELPPSTITESSVDFTSTMSTTMSKTTTEESLLDSLYSMMMSAASDPFIYDPQLETNIIRKRSDQAPILSESDAGLLAEDEDEVKSTLQEIGHKLMREQIDQYVDTVVATLTGLSDPGPSTQTPTGRYPVLKIFNLIKLIMQKTCGAVKGDYFELALNSFLKVQLESFHVKEPYINHNAFARIEYALKQCYNKGKSHVFVQSSQLNGSCSQSEGTSEELDVHGDGKEKVKLITPPYASGELEGGATREPLTETVWKMLVNAHSYCYPYFKAYFNDHHTLTVALLPLFNNQIQDIWLKEGGYDSNKGRLYGGLLGDTRKVLKDVDNCVAASRYVSQYPWYMNRPLKDSGNKWRRRRRRELPPNSEYLSPTPVFIDNGKRLCLFDPEDPVAFVGKPVCT